MKGNVSVCVCVCVCVFSIDIQTAKSILVKFGMGIFFDGRKVLSLVLTGYPNPGVRGALNENLGASAASAVQFDKTFITDLT